MSEVDFRRGVGTHVWHWNPKCRDWPKYTFECTHNKPFTGNMCTTCGIGEAEDGYRAA